MANKVMDGAKSALGGKEKAPKKEVESINTRKAKSGGYIHTHRHTHPEHHPDEEHITPDSGAMAAHMLQNLGTPAGPTDPNADPNATPPAATPPAAGAPAGAPAPAAGSPIPGM